MKKYEVHILCTRLMRQHPDWTDEQVAEAAGLKPLEMNLVEEARREVSADTESEVRSERTY